MLHDGELEDVRLLAIGAGADCVELRTGSAGPEPSARFRIVIGSGQRLAACSLPALCSSEARIAILEKDSKTLRSMLKRASVDYLVFRPVHPTALRLLVTRLLYQGPERRRGQRFPVGAPVSFRTGLWRRQALLAELSLQGCSLISAYSAKFGAKVTLWLASEITGDKPLCLSGRIVRIGPAGNPQPGSEALGIRFDAPGTRELAELRLLVARFRAGPAAWTGQALGAGPAPVARTERPGSPGMPAVAAAATTPNSAPTRRELPLPIRFAADDSSGNARALAAADADAAPLLLDEVLEPTAAPELESQDRRQEQRRTYPHGVISRADQKPCVLIGRDLSVGGMRVEATDRLELGLNVQVAIHVKAGEVPLVLSARVERDDGEDGFAMRFSGMSGTQEAYLRALLASMPALSSIVGDDEPIVLCEISAA